MQNRSRGTSPPFHTINSISAAPKQEHNFIWSWFCSFSRKKIEKFTWNSCACWCNNVTLFLYQPLLGFYDIWNVGTQYRMEGDLLTSGYGISPSSALSALQGSQVTSMIITVLLLSVSYLILTLSQSNSNVIRNQWAKYFRNTFCLVIGGWSPCEK